MILCLKGCSWIGNIDFPQKKKFRTQRLVNKFVLTVFLEMKKHIFIDFLEKVQL